MIALIQLFANAPRRYGLVDIFSLSVVRCIFITNSIKHTKKEAIIKPVMLLSVELSALQNQIAKKNFRH